MRYLIRSSLESMQLKFSEKDGAHQARRGFSELDTRLHLLLSIEFLPARDSSVQLMPIALSNIELSVMNNIKGGKYLPKLPVISPGFLIWSITNNHSSVEFRGGTPRNSRRNRLNAGGCLGDGNRFHCGSLKIRYGLMG